MAALVFFKCFERVQILAGPCHISFSPVILSYYPGIRLHLVHSS